MGTEKCVSCPTSRKQDRLCQLACGWSDRHDSRGACLWPWESAGTSRPSAAQGCQAVWKDQRHKQPPPSPPSSYLSISLPQLTMTHLFIFFFSLSKYLNLICFRSQLLLSCFHPSVLTIEPSVNIKMSWETRLSLIQTPFGVSRSRRSLQKTQSFRHAADLSFQWCSSGIFCWIVCF